MPVYEYRCEKGHTFEVVQRMSDDPVTSCDTCSASVQRVFHPVAVHFKGSGFYTTDYGRRKGGSSSGDSATKEAPGTSKEGGSAGSSSKDSTSTGEKPKPDKSSGREASA